jgi:hypothetical protein
MTEFNIFCYSKLYNDENSFQQSRYRAFNKEVEKERYSEILITLRKIIPNPNNLTLKKFWESITQEQWNKLLSIPEAKYFKEGFEFISGQKITEPTLNGTQDILLGKKAIVEIDGQKYNVTIESLNQKS